MPTKVSKKPTAKTASPAKAGSKAGAKSAKPMTKPVVKLAPKIASVKPASAKPALKAPVKAAPPKAAIPAPLKAAIKAVPAKPAMTPKETARAQALTDAQIASATQAAGMAARAALKASGSKSSGAPVAVVAAPVVVVQAPVVPAIPVEPPTFKVGDNAVYPGHGVGVVRSIEAKEIFGKKHEFYSIQILENGMKIMIPKDNVLSVGLRPIISRDEAAKVISILRETNVKIDNQTWNRRYREYMEKIKTGSVFEIAEVLRDLFLLKVDKELSFGERKMLDTARGLLLKELSLATSREELQGQDEVAAIFGLQGT
jgi:CarD family transcriptional regulator